jgi:shikimate kinase
LVVLVGPPGAGKSSVGEALAERLGLAFRDTDRDIEARTGSTIAELFIDQGETAFRELETTAVDRALADHDGVLAVGGGAVSDESTRRALRAERVVFLDVSLHDAVRRVGMNRDRPLLLGNVRSSLLALMEQRRPWYAEVSDHQLDTSGMSITAVVDDVEQFLGEDRG